MTLLLFALLLPAPLSAAAAATTPMGPQPHPRRLRALHSSPSSSSPSSPSSSPSSSLTLSPTTSATPSFIPLISGPPANATAPSPFEARGSAAELAACLNAHQPPDGLRGTSWQSAMADVPPHLRVAGLWWSSKPADAPLTITTQLSWNRRWQLKAMCRTWGGPIAAVMHARVPLHLLLDARRGGGGGSGGQRRRRPGGARVYSGAGGLDDVSSVTMGRVVRTVAAFHARMEATQPCKLDLMLVVEPYRDDKSLMMYPVNTLRNYARLMARTPLIGLVDVDLIVSASLRREMTDPAAAAAYVAAAAASVQAAADGAGGPSHATGESRTPDGSGGAGAASEAEAEDAEAEAAEAKAAEATGGQQLRRVLAEGSAGGNFSAAAAAAAAAAAVRRVAFVLPAFVTRGGSYQEQVERVDRLVAGSKQQLREAYEQGKVVRFNPKFDGHINTQYRTWFKTSKPYTVQWSGRYEPWLFVDRLSSAWADARFRGYGNNKIIHIRSIAYLGYELVVHPDAFLVHRPHRDSSASTAHDVSVAKGSRGSNSSMYGHNLHLYKMAQRDMAFGNYTPVLDPATAACRSKLSWWRDAPKL